MNSPFVMYKNRKTSLTLNPNYMTAFHRNAQVAELKELVKLISNQFSKTKRTLKILDIGIGDGRIPLDLSKSKVWDEINLLVGIENSKLEVDKTMVTIKDADIEDKVKVIKFDALNLESRKFELPEQKYDLIICTYFTPGNFKPDEIKIETGMDGKILPYSRDLLKPNGNFIKIFKLAYEMLNEGGKIFLGSIYIDTAENRKRQEDFYEKCGMTVITSNNDEFTATKEGFWSERFTKEKIYMYFSFIPKEKIEFISLDRYNFAMSVIVSK